MKLPSLFRAWPLALALAAVASVSAALVTGSIAYTKRFETHLLAEPNPLAAVSSRIPLGQKLTVQEIKGAWVNVRATGGSGWVFSGNISETKPDQNKGTDDSIIPASKTTATAAARGFSEVATDYAVRHNLKSAADDLDWMFKESDKVTTADVDNFLKEKKKGEFQ